MSSTHTPLLSSSNNDTSKKSISDKTLTGLANLIRLLPTGTVFVFQFLNRVLTNTGNCTTPNKYLTSFFIGISGLACSLSCFTDTYKHSDGTTHYGVATLKGLWPSTSTGSGSVDLSSYKLKVGDFVHAILVVLVFGVAALSNSKTLDCLFPALHGSPIERSLPMGLPLVIGSISAILFAVFPNSRQWIFSY